MSDLARSSSSASGRAAALHDYNPRSFDHLAEEYDFVAAHERKPDFFLKHLPARRGRVLDVGCGTGILAHELSRHFDSVVAIDISEPMLAIARARRAAPNIEYRQEDADLLVLGEKFDCIVSHTTLHHLRDVSETLARLRSALEPRGRIILIDNVRRWRVIPRNSFAFTAKACLKIPPDLFRHGRSPTWRMFRFRTSRHWLDHLKCDEILSPGEFRRIYSAALPGGAFVPLRYFMGVVWEAPGA